MTQVLWPLLPECESQVKFQVPDLGQRATTTGKWSRWWNTSIPVSVSLPSNKYISKKERKKEREGERERKKRKERKGGRKGKKVHFPYFIWADGMKERDKNKSFECHTMREGHCTELTWRLRCVLCGLRWGLLMIIPTGSVLCRQLKTWNWISENVWSHEQMNFQYDWSQRGN